MFEDLVLSDAAFAVMIFFPACGQAIVKRIQNQSTNIAGMAFAWFPMNEAAHDLALLQGNSPW